MGTALQRAQGIKDSHALRKDVLRYTQSLRRSRSSAPLLLRELHDYMLTLHAAGGDADLPKSQVPEKKGICTDQGFRACLPALKIMSCPDGCFGAHFFSRYVLWEINTDEK